MKILKDILLMIVLLVIVVLFLNGIFYLIFGIMLPSWINGVIGFVWGLEWRKIRKWMNID